MNQIGNAIKSNFSFRLAKSIHGVSSLLRETPRRFSAEAEQPPKDDSSVDSFLRPPRTGLVYGKLSGITRNTLKTDIVNLLEGCNLTLDDVKVDYSRGFAPAAMMVQFSSYNAFDHAIRMIGKKGRLYKLERADRSQWDITKPYDGKTILLQGIPINALPEDVERFLSGCQYDASSIQMFFSQNFPEPTRMATVRFSAESQAMNAFLTKNRGFCLNNQISVRVLH